MGCCLVRPLAEYATTAWSPHTSKGAAVFESIQRRAARFVQQDYRRTSSVTEMLDQLGLESLKDRRERKDLELFYNIHCNLLDIGFLAEISPSSQRTRGHDLRYRQPACAVNAFKYSFFPCTMPAWNSLESVAVKASNLIAFKAELTK